MDRQLKPRLETKLADKLAGPVRQRHDETEIRVTPANLLEVLRTLQDDPDLEFVILADVCGVDTGTTLQTVYHLWSNKSSDWLRIVAEGLPREDPRVPSITGIWPGAEWSEREAYDMFGIIFEGNRDLRRVYMPPDYASFPLRKDFYLPDDSARGPGGGVRHQESPYAPLSATETSIRRTVKA
jgi:NADH-quinone oxidoreductase subunit C